MGALELVIRSGPELNYVVMHKTEDRTGRA
jgi:hypothetical protein